MRFSSVISTSKVKLKEKEMTVAFILGTYETYLGILKVSIILTQRRI